MWRTAQRWAAEKVLLAGSLGWSVAARAPRRVRRIVLHARRAAGRVPGWVAAGRTGDQPFGSWLRAGVCGGLTWSGRLVLHLVELAGVGELVQLLWGLIFRLRPLTAAERAASASVHPPGLIPYRQVRVDEGSLLIRIGSVLAGVFRARVTPGAITSLHIVHAPAAGLGMPLAVHELTHVGQYEQAGAVYLLEALRAQASAAGYDYGDLSAARAAGARFADLNREQQAALCADYYRVCHGMAAQFGATEAELAPFVADMRSGRF